MPQTRNFTPKQNAFLQANQENLQQLVTFIDFAPETFTLGLVSINFPDDRDTIIETIKHHPDCQDIQFEVFIFDDPNLQFLRDEVLKTLSEIKRNPDKKLVLLITGLEKSIGMVDDYPPVLVDLNYVRDGFATNVPYPILLFLPDYSITRLAKFAPDIWVWHRILVKFKSSPETIRNNLLQLVFLIFKDSPSIPQRQNKKLDYQFESDIIPRVLKKYKYAQLPGNEDDESFRHELMTVLGTSLFDSYEVDKVKDLVDKVIKEGGSKLTFLKPNLLSYLGMIEGQQNNYEKALDLLNQSISELHTIDHDDAPEWKDCFKNALVTRGEIYQEMEYYSEAIADFDKAIDVDPEYEWAIANRGETYRLIEHYPEAIADFNHVIKLDPDYKWAITSRGQIYQAIEHYLEAIADFNRVIELDPQYEWAIASRGQTYREMKRYPEAITDFERAISLDPAYGWAIASRGEIYALIGNYDQALSDFNRAIKIDADSDWGFYFRSLIYRALGQLEKVEVDIARSIQMAQQEYEVKPQDCQTIFNLAIYHLTDGNLERTQHLFQEVLAKMSGVHHLKAAIRDLDDLLTILPHYPHAEAMRDLLKSELAQRMEDI